MWQILLSLFGISLVIHFPIKETLLDCMAHLLGGSENKFAKQLLNAFYGCEKRERENP